jgi:hypothetical protein
MSNIDPRTKQVLEKYCADPRAAVWNCHGKWVAYHAALEEIARNAKIRFDPPMVLEADGANKIAAICVTGHMDNKAEWSIGEAAPGNNKNAYPFAMAEKRAKDRVILKLIGLHGDVYSEEEADDFKPEQTPKPANKPSMKVSGKTPELWVEGMLKLIDNSADLGELADVFEANKEALTRLANNRPDDFDRIEKARGIKFSILSQAPQQAAE